MPAESPAEPTVLRPDDAKWELDDPHVHFAISRKGDRAPGLNHLGIQVTEPDELDALHSAPGAANITRHDEPCARCCDAESDKHWAVDPEGIVWETFHTMNAIAVYGEDRVQGLVPRAAAPALQPRQMPRLVPQPASATTAATTAAATAATTAACRTAGACA